MRLKLATNRHVVDLNDDEEMDSLVQEAVGGATASNNNGNLQNQSTADNKQQKSMVWRGLALIVLSIFILFVMDAIEIKQVEGGESDMDSIPGASNVQIKTPKTPALELDVTATPTSTGGGESAEVTGEATQRHSYKTRGQPMSDADREALLSKWGSWTLIDDKERPSVDYFKKYPNRDIPRNEFPSSAWQIDKDYLDKFLPEALALVTRAQEGILAEYGKTGPNRTEMFDLERLETLEGVDKLQTGRRGSAGRPSLDWGGWTTNKSWEGFKRRVLHAVMTEDSFIFAMGGHSAAAGHGNHFEQSYTLQVQWIMEAVFARLGVKHQSRNFSNGGLGTLQHGMAASSTYGPDVDMLMWDSGMTEGDARSKEVMARQVILGGAKVPILWSLASDVSQTLNLLADVDVGYPGTGHIGIPIGESLEQIEQMPWAMQYVRCNGEMHQICRQNEYIGVCWVDRDDFTPPTKQGTPGGRAGWHPGNRIHQVKGRILAYTILDALKDALTMWKEAPDYALPDDAWHVTAHYENIRSKVQALGPEDGECHKGFEPNDMEFVCNHAMKSRNEFTPRSFPSLTNIRNIMSPEMLNGVNPPPPKNIYDPPDVFNPSLHPPAGATDLLSIVEAGVDFKSTLNPDYVADFYKKPTFATPSQVPPGKGLMLDTKAGDDFCDGSVDSFCGRGADNACLLYAHNDGRHGIKVDGYSGWMVMNVPDVKYGYIVIKFESWHGKGSVAPTNGWVSINNETERLLSNSKNSTAFRLRKLKATPIPYCDDFKFEWAIDGKITSLNYTEYEAQKQHVQRVVEMMVVLKDPNYTGGVEKEVEVAFRISGCGREKAFNLSHIYWA